MMFSAWYAVMSWAGLTTALHVGEGEGGIEGVGGGRKWSRGILLIYHLTSCIIILFMYTYHAV